MKEKRIKRSSLPSFLTKLYEILENEDHHDIIHWSDDGKAFLVQNLSLFIDKVLPFYFKHSNFASFVRQLNMYDFHKSRNDPNECSFYHTKFIQGKKHLLKCIKRKVNHFSNDNEEDHIETSVPQVNKTDKALDDLIKRQSLLEDKFHSLIATNQDLNKEKEERLNYEKYLQVVLLLLINKYSKTPKESNNNDILFNCISNLDEYILNKLIDKSLELANINPKDIRFSFSQEECASTDLNNKHLDNKLFQLANLSQTNNSPNINNEDQRYQKNKEKELFNLTDEVNSVTQCLASTPTLSPPQASKRYSLDEFNDIEMFSTPNQLSIYNDMIF